MHVSYEPGMYPASQALRSQRTNGGENGSSLGWRMLMAEWDCRPPSMLAKVMEVCCLQVESVQTRTVTLADPEVVRSSVHGCMAAYAVQNGSTGLALPPDWGSVVRLWSFGLDSVRRPRVSLPASSCSSSNSGHHELDAENLGPCARS